MVVSKLAEVIFEVELMTTNINCQLFVHVFRCRKHTYGSGYLFSPRISISIADPSSVLPVADRPESFPPSLNARPGPYAFSFASRRIFVPSSL